MAQITCPHCKTEGMAHVVDSRFKDNRVHRRRQCQTCDERFSTVEMLNDDYERHTKLVKAAVRLREAALQILHLGAKQD